MIMSYIYITDYVIYIYNCISCTIGRTLFVREIVNKKFKKKIILPAHPHSDGRMGYCLDNVLCPIYCYFGPGRVYRVRPVEDGLKLRTVLISPSLLQLDKRFVRKACLRQLELEKT